MALTNAKDTALVSFGMEANVTDAYDNASPLDAQSPDAMITSKAYLALTLYTAQRSKAWRQSSSTQASDPATLRSCRRRIP